METPATALHSHLYRGNRRPPERPPTHPTLHSGRGVITSSGEVTAALECSIDVHLFLFSPLPYYRQSLYSGYPRYIDRELHLDRPPYSMRLHTLLCRPVPLSPPSTETYVFMRIRSPSPTPLRGNRWVVYDLTLSLHPPQPTPLHHRSPSPWTPPGYGINAFD